MAEHLDVASMMQAANDIEWFAARLTGVLKLGQEIRKLGSIANIADEISARTELLRREQWVLQASMTDQIAATAAEVEQRKRQAQADRAADDQRAAGEIASRHAAADREIAAKLDAARATHSDATHEAEQVRGQGAREARELLEQAKREVLKQAEAAVAAQAEHDRLARKIASANVEHDAMMEAKRAAESELNSLKSELAALKTRLGL